MTPALSYLLYAVFAVGGLGVYLALPRQDRSTKTAGALFALAALAGAMVVCANLMAPTGSNTLFYIFATVALVSAVKMITHEKPVYSAVYFVLTVLSVALLMLLQMAEFLAVALVIVYAGAILVTYVFVIMLAQQGGQPACDRRAREPFVAVLVGFVAMAAVAGELGDLPDAATEPRGTLVSVGPPATESPGNTQQVGQVMMTHYIVALELAGLLLLIAMIGAIAMSKKRVPVDQTEVPAAPPGQIGREVPPF